MNKTGIKVRCEHSLRLPESESETDPRARPSVFTDGETEAQRKAEGE